MRTDRFVFFCGIVALAQLAMADAPNPDGLGTVHAMLTYCAQADPHHAAAYRAAWNGADSGEAQGSDYKKAYDLATSQLAGMSHEDAARVCANFVPAAPTTPGGNVPDKGGDRGGSSR